MGENYIIAVRNILKLKGRASKEEFWTFFLVNALITMLAYVLLSFFYNLDSKLYDGWSMVFGMSFVFIGIRRFHDLGRSGWNILWGLIPMVGAIVLLLAFIQKGEEHENEFGMSRNKDA